MSDRSVKINLTGVHPDDRLTLYCDGESGTFRLFVDAGSCMDMSLHHLQQLQQELSSVIQECEADPWNNPAHRKAFYASGCDDYAEWLASQNAAKAEA